MMDIVYDVDVFYTCAAGLALEMMKQGAMLTVLSTLLTALAWPATLLTLTDFIDSKWTIAVDRFLLLLEWSNIRWDEGRGRVCLDSHILTL